MSPTILRVGPDEPVREPGEPGISLMSQMSLDHEPVNGIIMPTDARGAPR
jgi:hypothetical protein